MGDHRASIHRYFTVAPIEIPRNDLESALGKKIYLELIDSHIPYKK